MKVFIIINKLSEYWTSSYWSANLIDAQLYATQQDALNAMKYVLNVEYVVQPFLMEKYEDD